MKVAVLGASADPDRYSYLAVQRLRAGGHEVTGVNPKRPDLGPVPVVSRVEELPTDIHTLTVYVAPSRSEGLAEAILQTDCRRIIFNPGSENPALAARLVAAGREVLEACTLVMLATGRFDAEA